MSIVKVVTWRAGAFRLRENFLIGLNSVKR